MEDRRQRILIIDDEPEILEAYQVRLRGSGFDVITCGDARSGLMIARDNRPDLILLDIMMPGKSGFDILSELRRDSEISDTPVLILTARSDKEAILRLAKLRIQGYLLKTTDATRLVRRIREAMQSLKNGEGSAEPATAAEPGGVAPECVERKKKSNFECIWPDRAADLPADVAILELKGELRADQVGEVCDVAAKKIAAGQSKIVIDLSGLKWSYVNVDHIQDIGQRMRKRKATVRFVAVDSEVRMCIVRHRVEAFICSTLNDALSEF